MQEPTQGTLCSRTSLLWMAGLGGGSMFTSSPWLAVVLVGEPGSVRPHSWGPSAGRQ